LCDSVRSLPDDRPVSGQYEGAVSGKSSSQNSSLAFGKEVARSIYCDNATNFFGAKNELRDLKTTLYSDEARDLIKKTCSQLGTEFHFIPSQAPHFGGLWEKAVKSAKHLLIRSVSTADLTYEVFETVVIDTEAISKSLLDQRTTNRISRYS